jgi:hypothetical protein
VTKNTNSCEFNIIARMIRVKSLSTAGCRFFDVNESYKREK